MIEIDVLSELLTEKEKSNPDYIQQMTDHICNYLITDKDHLRKAYNYYNGVVDKDQYRAIEENYGIGSPTSIQFIPLIKRHVDALIGRHLQTRVTPKITCKDKETLSNIHRQKQLEVKKLHINSIKESLHNNIVYHFMTPEEKQQNKPPIDIASDQALKKQQEDFDRNFISEYELAAQHMLRFLSQSKNIDLDNKKKILILDLLVTGECFYKVTIPKIGETPDIEVLNPIDVFYEKNVNSPYVKDSTRAAIRRYMNKQQIISKYGDKLSREDIKRIDSQIRIGNDYSANVMYIRSPEGSIVSNVGVSTTDAAYDNDISKIYNNYYPVYEVEWLSNTEVEEDGKRFFRTDRYEAVRIGTNIYIELGKSEHVVRSIEHPNRCTLSINGMAYSDRNGRPFSLVIATMPLQD